MRKVLHFDSSRAHYDCDAAVVWCYDNRFELALRKLLKRTGVLRPDQIRVAGGAKCLSTPDLETIGSSCWSKSASPRACTAPIP